VKPRAVEAMVTCGRTEVPNPRISRSGQKAVADQFVTSPLPDDGARDVADVVLIKTEHRAQA
jgi:hypothetical protein